MSSKYAQPHKQYENPWLGIVHWCPATANVRQERKLRGLADAVPVRKASQVMSIHWAWWPNCATMWGIKRHYWGCGFTIQLGRASIIIEWEQWA